jgi:REP element-mobilizing transposase RayT
MPKGLLRFHHTGDWHFITCSCYRRQKFLDSARRRDLFLEILEQVRVKYDFVVAGYVVMPEHFHLLIGEPRGQEVIHGDAGVEAASLASLSREEKKKHEANEAVGRPEPAGFLANSILRLQCLSTEKVCRETALHSPQSSEARPGEVTGAVALEQFSGLLVGGNGEGENRQLALSARQ